MWIKKHFENRVLRKWMTSDEFSSNTNPTDRWLLRFNFFRLSLDGKHLRRSQNKTTLSYFSGVVRIKPEITRSPAKPNKSTSVLWHVHPACTLVHVPNERNYRDTKTDVSRGNCFFGTVWRRSRVLDFLAAFFSYVINYSIVPKAFLSYAFIWMVFSFCKNGRIFRGSYKFNLFIFSLYVIFYYILYIVCVFLLFCFWFCSTQVPIIRSESVSNFFWASSTVAFVRAFQTICFKTWSYGDWLREY